MIGRKSIDGCFLTGTVTAPSVTNVCGSAASNSSLSRWRLPRAVGESVAGNAVRLNPWNRYSPNSHADRKVMSVSSFSSIGPSNESAKA
jgi:hypothetical protein